MNERNHDMNASAPENAAVWFEIPVSDMERAKAFYSAVTGCELTDNHDGPNPMAVFASAGPGSVSGHLYPGKPAGGGSGNTIHLAVPGNLEDAMKRVSDNGGSVISPIVTIPAGRFAYCTDPDGNSIGIFTA
jgi:predicted enzyme related to lactoylglutathione lyase